MIYLIILLLSIYYLVLQVLYHSNGNARKLETKLGSGSEQTSASPIYSTLEDQDCAKLKTPDEVSYNVLEREPQASWKTTSNSKEFYNTALEDPSYAKINKTTEQQSDLPYNVLERGPVAYKRNKENEPFYDALEKPGSTVNFEKSPEAPIYNTFEDPDYAAPLKKTEDSRRRQEETIESPIYNVLEDPNSPSSPLYAVLEKPKSEEDCILTNMDLDKNDEYNHAEDVIYQNTVEAVDSNVYQKLNDNRQSSMEKQYEPLRHSKMFIDMKEMTGDSHA